ncbi:MAG: hypothetical protein JWM11_4151, partial [Planctomycetaceae bacterium]|nr:hypothetical protein [Planctomycetaceae bacterium]
TSMFARAFFELHERLNLRQLFRLTEPEMIRHLQEQATGTPAAELLNGVFGPKRLIYKRVAEYTLHQDPEIYARLARKPYGQVVRYATEFVRRLQARSNQSISACDLLIDAPPVHREVEINIPIYYARQNVYRQLDEVSPVVAALARTQFDDIVKRVRIYAHPLVAEELKNIKEFDTLLLEAVAAVDQ